MIESKENMRVQEATLMLSSVFSAIDLQAKDAASV